MGNSGNLQGILGQVSGMSEQEKAEKIAKWCNQNGITKEQLAKLINSH